MELLSLDEQKQYPTITIESVIKAFEILQIPESFYSLDQEYPVCAWFTRDA